MPTQPPAVDLVLAVKPLHRAKSRLRAGGVVPQAVHTDLVLAFAADTVAAALASPLVGRVVVVSSDPRVGRLLPALAARSVTTSRRGDLRVVPDQPHDGLNAAFRHGAAMLPAGGSGPATASVGALQADLPALRTGELESAVRAAWAAGASRAFCADRAGTGTTLLLAAPGRPLDPRFGPGSATGHLDSGAAALAGGWPGLRCDIDTGPDLAEAQRIGVGRHTAAVLARLDADRPTAG